MTNQDTYREHSVGSHSDDSGGDSDLPCYCDRRINQDTTSIDEQIIELLKDFNGYDFCGEKACSSQAKASELIKYLKALISDQVQEARIEAYEECLQADSMSFSNGLDFDYETHITNRIAQLRSIPNDTDK